MSQGNPIVKARLSAKLFALIEETIERRNANSANPPWDMSAFLRQAILDKLRIMRHSRTWRKGGRKEVGGGTEA